jgi:hypothetical protein
MASPGDLDTSFSGDGKRAIDFGGTDDVRIDQSCVMRKLRRDFIRRLGEVDSIGEIPFDIDREIRQRATELLQDPSTFSGPEGCGGTRVDPDAQLKFEQRTRIGRYVGGR